MRETCVSDLCERFVRATRVSDLCERLVCERLVWATCLHILGDRLTTRIVAWEARRRDERPVEIEADADRGLLGLCAAEGL